MHPSGSDSAAAQAVYQDLYAHYLAAIPLQRTEILWSGPGFIALYAIVLVGFVFISVFWLRHLNLSESRLYELTSFGGYLTERIGQVSMFNFVIWTVFALWAAYFAIRHILFGLNY